MELPFSLKAAIENMLNGVSMKDLTAASETLTKRYTEESGAGKRLVRREIEALAYSVSRMPATFAAIKSALDRANIYNVETMLDMGAGTGAACWAAFETFENLSQVTCVEREDIMADMGKRLMTEGGFSPKSVWISSDAQSFDTSERFDLVTSAYCLNELTQSDRLRAAEKLWKFTKTALVIIEPGTPVGYKNLMEIRSRLTDMGARIAAPCPREDKCPLPKNDWCHFSCRVARSKAHKMLKGGDAPYEDEKFSYMIFTREKAETPSARIIRHPQVQSGKITIQTCERDSLKERVFIKKDSLFKAARKAAWGDEFV